MAQLPPIARAHLQRPGGSDHLDADLITAFAEQSLPAAEREHVVDHLSRCAHCREVAVLAGAEPEDASVEDQRGGEHEERELVTAAAPPSHMSAQISPQTVGRVAAGASGSASAAGPDRALWFGHRPSRWLAVAACGLICATVLVRYPALWRGKAPATADGNIPVDQVADERTTSRVPVPVAPARPGAPASNPAAVPQAAVAAKTARPELGAPRSGEYLRTSKPTAAAPASPALGAQARSKEKATAADQSPPLDQSGLAQSQPESPATDSAAQSAPAVASAARSAEPKQVPAPVNAAPKRVGGSLQKFGAARNESRISGSAGAELGGAAGGAAGVNSGGGAATAANSTQPAPQWTLTENGIPQRSDDDGHTWQKFSVDSSVQFRALYADQEEVWVGGRKGALYHSSDAGAHWTRVQPKYGDATLSTDISRISFTGRVRGDVTTAKGEVWSTYDGGTNWVRH